MKIISAAFLVLVTAFVISSPSLAQDSDGDGVTDLIETAFGSNPNNTAITPTAIKLGGEVNEGGGQMPSLVWTGSEFGLGRYDSNYGDMYFARLSSTGAKLSEASLTNPLGGWYPPNSLAWSGSVFGFTFGGPGHSLDFLDFVQFQANGAQSGSDILYANNSTYNGYDPAMVWANGYFGIAWNNSSTKNVYFTRCASTSCSSPVGLNSGSGGSTQAAIAWSGSQYGVVWTKSSSIYFVRVSSTGTKLGTEAVISGGLTGANPQIVWNGTEYGVVWDGVNFVRVSAAGDKIGTESRITAGSHPSLVRAGSEYALGFSRYSGGKYEIRFTTLSTAGEMTLANVLVSSFSSSLDYSAPAWTGSEFGLAWQSQGTGVLFTRLVLDHDGDGLADAAETLTNPMNWDTDGDALSDGDEVNLFGTDPTGWDTDGDYLSDGYEVANATYLDPLNSLDALADPDDDGNLTGHEYYNLTDPWTPEPFPIRGYQMGCYFWGKSDTIPFVGPKDIVEMQKAYAGVASDLSHTMPAGYDPLDVDRDKYPGPGDITTLQAMYAQANRPDGYPSSPSELTVLEAPAPTVAVGGTTHVTLSVHAQGPGTQLFSPGFGVVFWVSTGNAVLLGGEGSDPTSPAGNRYDISMRSDHGAPATMTVLVTGPGPIVINAKVPACGMKPHGRWSDEVLMAAPLVINQ